MRIFILTWLKNEDEDKLYIPKVGKFSAWIVISCGGTSDKNDKLI